jgi:hypothetical protein
MSFSQNTKSIFIDFVLVLAFAGRKVLALTLAFVAFIIRQVLQAQ